MKWARIGLLVVLMAMLTGGTFTCKGSKRSRHTTVDVSVHHD